MKRRTFFYFFLGVLFLGCLVSLASCHVITVPRLGVLGYDGGLSTDLNAGIYDTIYRVGNRWFVDGNEVTDGWFATIVFNQASATALDIVVVCAVLFGPGIALLVITKNQMTFFIGIFVGVGLGYVFLPTYFPLWMVFGVILANSVLTYTMVKR